MLQLTEEHWRPLMADNKGLKFEDLVADLLKEMFPHVPWKATKKTYDGKKDFMVTLPVMGVNDSHKYWVECKNHGDSVSINTLSPTLVMAVIEKIRGVYFFSYSPVNRNAKEYLQQFRERADKDIVTYDGDFLETTLLQYPSILKKYFPKFKQSTQSFFAKKKSIECFAKFRRDTAYNYANEVEFDYAFSGNRILQVNETFCLDLFIQNVGVKEKNIEIKIVPDQFDKHFALLDNDFIKNGHQQRITLQPGRSYFKRVSFRLETFRQRLDLPKIYIYENNILLEEIDLGVVKGNWIINAPLSGSPYLEIIDSIRNTTAYRNTLITHCIYGESGVGKSRLLKETKDVLLSNGYRMYSEDGDFQNQQLTGIMFLRKLISELSGLPLKHLFNSDNSINTKLQSTTGAIMELLYSDKYSLQNRIDEILEIFLSYIELKPLAIIIDNIQFYDDDLALFFHRLLNLTTQNSRAIVIILSFNTDYLFPQTKMFELFEQIRNIAKEKSDQIFCMKVSGFQNRQALSYINHCIPDFSNQYPETANLLLQKVGNIPFYIEQTLHLLSDKGAIVKSGDFFYVADIQEFHSCLNILPNSVSQLLELRWKFLQDVKIIKIDESVLKFTSFFQKLPLELVNALELDVETIENLLRLGILEQNSMGNIVFHHAQLFHFFNDRYFKLVIDKKIAQKAVSIIEKFNLADSFPGQYFIAKNSLKPGDKDVLSFGATCLLNNTVGREYRSKFAKQLYNSLQLIEHLKGISLLQVYTKICDDVKKYDEFALSQKLFKQIYEERFVNYQKYIQYGNDYFHFILRYVNSFLATHRDKDAHHILLHGLNKIDEFEFSSPMAKIKAKASLLNRLCVTYKSLNEPTAAENVAQESLELAKLLGNKEIIIKNYIDTGYIYYKNADRMQDLLNNWNKAWEIFNADYDDSLKRKRVSAYYHKALVEIIEGRLAEAAYFSEMALNASEQELDIFNKIKIVLAKALIAHLNNQKNPDETVRLAREAIDLCIKSNSIRSYWTSWHVLGKVSNDSILIVNAYITALKLLSNFVIDEKMEQLYNYFFDDLFIVMRWHRKISEKDQLLISGHIRSKRIKAQMKKIFSMNDDSFQAYLESFRPTTPITDKRTNFPCP